VRGKSSTTNARKKDDDVFLNNALSFIKSSSFLKTTTVFFERAVTSEPVFDFRYARGEDGQKRDARWSKRAQAHSLSSFVCTLEGM